MKSIIEINSINQVLEHVPSSTDIVFFDIDNTLLGAANGIHPTQWVHRFDAYVRTIYAQKYQLTPAQQDELITQHLADFIHAMEPALVENSALEVLQQLQNKNIPVIALTARPASTALTTIKQLARCGIDLSQHGLNPKYFVTNSFVRPIVFQDGVITCCKNPKGFSAQHFFDITQFAPKSVVLVDDMLSFLEESAQQFEHISFTGLRYGYLDEEIKNFAFSSDLIPQHLR